MGRRTNVFIAVVISLSVSLASAENFGGLGGGGSLDRPHGVSECVSDAARAVIAARVAAARQQYGSSAASTHQGVLYPAFPLGGNVVGVGQPGDIYPNGYFDTDPTSGFTDFRCGNFTYDGHRGVDVDLKTFDEQTIGVPVFAAFDGRVLVAQDGQPDMNLNGSTNPGNYVIIDHGNNRDGWYFHLRRNSVNVTVNQLVRAGQQIGFAASSGNSFWPHLHFESQENAVPVDPYHGPCQTQTGAWSQQERFEARTYARDFGVTSQDLNSAPFFPFAPPRQAQIAFSEQPLFFWLQGANLPPNSTWLVRFRRPDGSIEYTSGPWSFNNADWYRSYGFWWNYFVGGMQTIPGTWRIEMEFNNQLVMNAPVEVVPTRNPNFNRPPVPVSLRLDPAVPDIKQPVYCRVASSLTLDDLDWDFVRYQYEWRVNAQTVRTITSAGRADALAAGQFQAGDSIECRVTPNDGSVNGPLASTQATAADFPWRNLGYAAFSQLGPRDVPHLAGEGLLQGNSIARLQISNGPPNGTAFLFLGFSGAYLPIFGLTLVPLPTFGAVTVPLDTAGSGGLSLNWPFGTPSGFQVFSQALFIDNLSPLTLSASNGVVATAP